jgi:hypothetical protein
MLRDHMHNEADSNTVRLAEDIERYVEDNGRWTIDC